jgi:hypothetical protein
LVNDDVRRGFHFRPFDDLQRRDKRVWIFHRHPL